jgi:hypothetical protein
MRVIKEVNEDCEITYEDGHMEACSHRPPYVYADCDIGYGSHRGCPKYNFYHKDD